MMRVCKEMKTRKAWDKFCNKDPTKYCEGSVRKRSSLTGDGCEPCKKVPLEIERLVPTEVQKKTCGVGGPGGPVHDGRAPSMKEYHVGIQKQRTRM